MTGLHTNLREQTPGGDIQPDQTVGDSVGCGPSGISTNSVAKKNYVMKEQPMS